MGSALIKIITGSRRTTGCKTIGGWVLSDRNGAVWSLKQDGELSIIMLARPMRNLASGTGFPVQGP